MSYIFVFGRVMQDITPKESQAKQLYTCFDLMERTGNNPPDYYQVWASGAHIPRLIRLGVKRGSMIWLTGSQRLVDVRMKDGKTVRKPKVWLTDFGLLPGNKHNVEVPQHEFDSIAEPSISPTDILDGDHIPLPE